MPKISAPGLHRVRSKGRTYHYAWRGGPRLLSHPGTDAFIQELALARQNRKTGDRSRISGLTSAWLASDAWVKSANDGGLATSTKKNWRTWVDEIGSHFGTLRIKVFDRPEIRADIRRWRNKWRATPRAADMGKQVLSALLTFAVEEGHLSANPCFGIPNLYKSNRAALVWTDADVAKLTRVASPEIGWALRLATLTGLRQGDLLKLSWSHIGEFSIEIPTGKSSQRRTAVIPRFKELDLLLAEIPKRATTVLTNSAGRPWKTGFGASWNKAMKAVGDSPLHFHDARGTFATKAYLSDLTVREIAEILAWSEDKVDRIVARYVQKNALTLDRIRRMDGGSAGRVTS